MDSKRHFNAILCIACTLILSSLSLAKDFGSDIVAQEEYQKVYSKIFDADSRVHGLDETLDLLKQMNKFKPDSLVEELIELAEPSKERCTEHNIFKLQFLPNLIRRQPAMVPYVDHYLKQQWIVCKDKLAEDMKAAVDSIPEKDQSGLKLMNRIFHEITVNNNDMQTNASKTIGKGIWMFLKQRDSQWYEDLRADSGPYFIDRLIGSYDSFASQILHKTGIIAHTYWNVKQDVYKAEEFGEHATEWLPRIKMLDDIKYLFSYTENKVRVVSVMKEFAESEPLVGFCWD